MSSTSKVFTKSQVQKVVPYKNIVSISQSPQKALAMQYVSKSTFIVQVADLKNSNTSTMATDKEIPIEDMMMQFFDKTSKPPSVNVFRPELLQKIKRPCTS